jgi:hypothetical protein
MISLLDQPQPLQVVLKAGIRVQTGNALFKTFFPDIGPTYKPLRQLLKQVAIQHKYMVLADRLSKDIDIGQEGGRVLNHRIGNMRGKAKSVVSSLVGTSYGIEALGSVAVCKELVKSLLDEGSYSYPRTQSGSIVDTKPYYHPCIITGIRRFFFVGSHGSLAQ